MGWDGTGRIVLRQTKSSSVPPPSEDYSHHNPCPSRYETLTRGWFESFANSSPSYRANSL